MLGALTDPLVGDPGVPQPVFTHDGVDLGELRRSVREAHRAQMKAAGLEPVELDDVSIAMELPLELTEHLTGWRWSAESDSLYYELLTPVET